MQNKKKPIKAELITRLEYKSYFLRRKLLQLTGKIGGAHIGGSFSMMEMVVCLYHSFLKVDPINPKKADRDIFILSKGHAGVGYCLILADLGFFPEQDLDTFNQTGSKFGVHPDHKAIPGVEASTGSLGHGLGLALGIALAKKLDGKSERVVALLSDGEMCEGSVWEALLAAHHYKTGNLLAIIDYNKMSQDGPLSEIMELAPLKLKLETFGWRVHEIDGHNIHDILHTLRDLPDPATSKQPTAILMNTIKGKGVPFMENTVLWHYGGMDTEVEKKALAALDETYNSVIERFKKLETP
ncbi:MAG: transketolase [Bdellovibrio sp.]|nr:transketolase [Bdellovibrio sp.]